jgi:hypothetical protein
MPIKGDFDYSLFLNTLCFVYCYKSKQLMISDDREITGGMLFIKFS